ncbi:MFS transporter [Nocardia asteroides]|uniref:Major facilitator superfamily transporter n=1 Tax=Nocardia asteroides NBRC 15531 TaxID=1110697 RepID=U5E511_NOCAS|nr:MFS transporter [Nocardia asteroides]UGT48166.1 MFS transporter [Nocardia asteroides]GAD84647.1 putative major facilitator superfamily transporter [Nocardia asteroides NBRC 15531]SFN70863.1 Predicted arabinose efflux permease, MFS family [Nocardia asteroides]VEG32839.1 Purine ribonucleoside efflux pump nepI [Nocardia asteroides]
MTTTSTLAAAPHTGRRAWPALLTMFLGSFTLVTAEFLPPGVLTALADDLRVPEGVVGLSVSATALTALLAALGLGSLFPKVDRRTLLLVLTVGAAVSNVLVAVAPNIATLLLARLLLGVAVGGYWSMALVIAAQLVPAERLGRAMMIVNAGTTVATVAGVPLGVLLSTYAGWRTVFVVAAGLTVLAAVAVRLMLPPIAPSKGIGFAAMGAALRAPGVALGLVSVVAVIGGHFAGFTYIRPALTELMDAGPTAVPVLLALFGIGGLIGNFVLGSLADRRLEVLLVAVPTAIGLSLLAIIGSAAVPVLGYVAVVVWGGAFGGILNLVQVWVSRVLPDRIEAGSGLVVGGFQLAIILGSAVGGRGVDGIGLAATYGFAAGAAILGGVLVRVSLARSRG